MSRRFYGGLSEMDVWDVELTEAEIKRLADGEFPWRVRPDALKGFTVSCNLSLEDEVRSRQLRTT